MIDRKALTAAIVELEERRIQVWIGHEQECEHDECPVEIADIGCGDAEELATEYERIAGPALVETMARAISRTHDAHPLDSDDEEDLPSDPQLDASDEWWVSPRRLARQIVNRMKD